MIGYERTRAWLPLETSLPLGIAEPDHREVLARLERSHFVFLTEEGPDGLYPYDRKMTALRPELRAWCEANLVLTQALRPARPAHGTLPATRDCGASGPMNAR